MNEQREQDTTLDTCTQCGGADFQARNVRSAFWQDERLVVVEDIPALVCGSCGEQYYDDAVMMALDLMRGDGFPTETARGEMTVPVYSVRDRLTGNAEK